MDGDFLYIILLLIKCCSIIINSRRGGLPKSEIIVSWMTRKKKLLSKTCVLLSMPGKTPSVGPHLKD